MPEDKQVGSTLDVKAIALEVAAILKQTLPQENKAGETDTNITVDGNTTTLSNKCYDALDEAEAELVKQLANPKIVIMRGKRGSYAVNQTQEALNALNDYRRDKKTFGTGRMIR